MLIMSICVYTYYDAISVMISDNLLLTVHICTYKYIIRDTYMYHVFIIYKYNILQFKFYLFQ